MINYKLLKFSLPLTFFTLLTLIPLTSHAQPEDRIFCPGPEQIDQSIRQTVSTRAPTMPVPYIACRYMVMPANNNTAQKNDHCLALRKDLWVTFNPLHLIANKGLMILEGTLSCHYYAKGSQYDGRSYYDIMFQTRYIP